jgi:hypothetical protein
MPRLCVSLHPHPMKGYIVTALTKQGVRDLNGPRMNGAGYNGHKSSTCPHHRAPDTTPTHIIERMVSDDGLAVRTGRFTCCSVCGDEIYENL